MPELGWLFDLITVIVLIRFVTRLFSGATRPAPPDPRQTRQTRQTPPSGGERAGGSLVRDPQCGTYVPESRSITVGTGANTLHFCSTACRDAWSAAHAGGMASGVKS